MLDHSQLLAQPYEHARDTCEPTVEALTSSASAVSA